MPKLTLGDLADKHFRLELQIQAAKQVVKELEEDQDKVALEAIELSREQKNPVCRGKYAAGEVKPRELYNIENFASLWRWCKDKDTFLFQRRIGAEAFRELRDASVKVPGIKVITQHVFKTKKLRGK